MNVRWAEKGVICESEHHSIGFLDYTQADLRDSLVGISFWVHDDIDNEERIYLNHGEVRSLLWFLRKLEKDGKI